jgi:hypothetical protein
MGYRLPASALSVPRRSAASGSRSTISPEQDSSPKLNLCDVGLRLKGQFFRNRILGRIK